MDSNQLLVGLLGSVGRLELDGRHVVEIAVQTRVVVPVDPPEGGKFHVLDRLPWPLGGPPDERDFGFQGATHPRDGELTLPA